MLHVPPASECSPALNDEVTASERDAARTTTRATALPSFVAAAERRLAATCERVTEFGRRLADRGCASDEDRDAWVAVHAKLRDDVSALAAAVSSLPIGAPEREAARKALGKLSDLLMRIELPVLARLDAGFAKSWIRYNGTAPDLEDAALSARLECYGLTPDEPQRYVLTGNGPVALERARELVFDEKTAMYDEALAKTNALPAAAGGNAPTPDANAAAGACASTWKLVEKLTPRAGSGVVVRIATPLHGVPLSPQQRARHGPGRAPGSVAPEVIGPAHGIPRTLLDGSGIAAPDGGQETRLVTAPLQSEPDDE